MKETMNKTRVCMTCHKSEEDEYPDFRTCSTCQIVDYCSEICQSVNYKPHQNVCYIFEENEYDDGYFWLKKINTLIHILDMGENYKATEVLVKLLDKGGALFNMVKYPLLMWTLADSGNCSEQNRFCF